ncbi:hypothetical protein A1O3_02799 [Capronia epimyces CBS 606.96]|uniref:Uncharacterized protein n=1 Tax=Capronia epimyces CBS 606.96 TaxID=1182542 RepID=W9YA42_9EURO|nr:uncharacterized protein A1O3_02799 [Capronia epimyces CBS 606.96]EXJ89732.1 hypothetical protein A1O3_02799 [Capronia epimyces CBS 606.96]
MSIPHRNGCATSKDAHETFQRQAKALAQFSLRLGKRVPSAMISRLSWADFDREPFTSSSFGQSLKIRGIGLTFKSSAAATSPPVMVV